MKVGLRVVSLSRAGSPLGTRRVCQRHGGPWSVQVTLCAARKSPYPIRPGEHGGAMGPLASHEGETHMAV